MFKRIKGIISDIVDICKMLNRYRSLPLVNQSDVDREIGERVVGIFFNI